MTWPFFPILPRPSPFCSRTHEPFLAREPASTAPVGESLGPVASGSSGQRWLTRWHVAAASVEEGADFRFFRLRSLIPLLAIGEASSRWPDGASGTSASPGLANALVLSASPCVKNSTRWPRNVCLFLAPQLPLGVSIPPSIPCCQMAFLGWRRLQSCTRMAFSPSAAYFLPMPPSCKATCHKGQSRVPWHSKARCAVKTRGQDAAPNWESVSHGREGPGCSRVRNNKCMVLEKPTHIRYGAPGLAKK
ncbi:hypothetical protein X797_006746 [Metarhizium robertsii]|uniref:Uncharacterized protein n=1 Tax=Metarhizium robertsii TaxID=568076 RepID=A0A0A1UU73_9HYPO|nr:hypothetical protein X797_006746 [Metarhizium robertsii]